MDINSIIEMINKEVRPFAKTQHMDYECGYDDACDDIIEQLRKMSDEPYIWLWVHNNGKCADGVFNTKQEAETAWAEFSSGGKAVPMYK